MGSKNEWITHYGAIGTMFQTLIIVKMQCFTHTKTKVSWLQKTSWPYWASRWYSTRRARRDRSRRAACELSQSVARRHSLAARWSAARIDPNSSCCCLPASAFLNEILSCTNTISNVSSSLWVSNGTRWTSEIIASRIYAILYDLIRAHTFCSSSYHA